MSKLWGGGSRCRRGSTGSTAATRCCSTLSRVAHRAKRSSRASSWKTRGVLRARAGLSRRPRWGSLIHCFRPWKCLDSTGLAIASSVFGTQKPSCSVNPSTRSRFALPICGRHKSCDAGHILRNRNTKENRGIETFSIPRFIRCAGAIRSMYHEVWAGIRVRLAA